MATIRKRGEFSWEAQIRRKGQPTQTKTCTYREDAEKWARQIEAEIDRGLYLPRKEAERTTFGEVAKRFTEDFAPHHYRGKAWQHKLAALTSRLSSYALVALTPAVVAKYRDDRLADPDPRYKKNTDAVPRISTATVKSELDILSKVLDVTQKEFSITLPNGNPVNAIRKPKGAKSRDRRLSAKEWEALEKECLASKNTWLHPALLLAVETAMRQGELLTLDWKHIDKKRRLALLLDPEKIKTAEPRAVPLTSAAMSVLDGLPDSIGGRILPIDRMTLYKAFERACQRAGIKDYRWHDLRHEALSRLAERGDLSVLELAAVSGHKTLQMLKRYTHLQAENLARKLG